MFCVCACLFIGVCVPCNHYWLISGHVIAFASACRMTRMLCMHWLHLMQWLDHVVATCANFIRWTTQPVRCTASSQVLHPTHIAVVQAATHRFVIGDTLRRVLQIVSTVSIVHETHKLPATIFNITPTRIDFFFSQRLSSSFCLSHYFVLLKSHRSMNMIQIKKKNNLWCNCFVRKFLQRLFVESKLKFCVYRGSPDENGKGIIAFVTLLHLVQACL